MAKLFLFGYLLTFLCQSVITQDIRKVTNSHIINLLNIQNW